MTAPTSLSSMQRAASCTGDVLDTLMGGLRISSRTVVIAAPSRALRGTAPRSSTAGPPRREHAPDAISMPPAERSVSPCSARGQRATSGGERVRLAARRDLFGSDQQVSDLELIEAGEH